MTINSFKIIQSKIEMNYFMNEYFFFMYHNNAYLSNMFSLREFTEQNGLINEIFTINRMIYKIGKTYEYLPNGLTACCQMESKINYVVIDCDRKPNLGSK